MKTYNAEDILIKTTRYKKNGQGLNASDYYKYLLF